MPNDRALAEAPSQQQDVRPTPEFDLPDIPDGVFSPWRASRILRDPYRKSLWRMALDIAMLWRETGQRPGRYLRHFMYRTHVTNPRGWLTEADQVSIWRHLARWECGAILNDKVAFQRHFSTVPGVRLPAWLGHTVEGVFHCPDGARRSMRSEDEVISEVESMLALARAAGASAVFAKPAQGYRGLGLFRLTNTDEADALVESVATADYVFQQSVVQHPFLAAVMPDVLNTVRMTTVRRDRGEPAYATAWAKLGRTGYSGDAEGPATLTAAVAADGRLANFAFTKWRVGVETYTHHPDTGAPVAGIRIPDFRDAIDLVETAAKHIDYPIVGWDVGFSTEGPVLIEGNTRPGYVQDEMCQGIAYRFHPVLGPAVRDFLEASRDVRPD